MPEWLIKLTLGPLLLVQGWHTRRVTPRLPEAAGERSGEQGSGPYLRLLIAGDSSAAGVGVAHQHDALAGQLAAELATDFRLGWRLIAQSGVDTPQLTALLQSRAAESFDAVVLSIGVNDVTGGCSPKAWRQAMQQLLQLLRSRFGVRQLVLLRVPPMHVFTGLPQPLRWYMGYRARRFNLQLEALVAEYPDCLLSEELTLAGPLLAADGFHPGALIYKRWAAVIADLLRHCRK